MSKSRTGRSRIHDTFHVSMLSKYIPDPLHISKEQPRQLKENLMYEETPVQIVDHRCAISTINYFPNEVCSFPFFWSLVYSFRGRNVPKEGGFCNTPS